MANQLAVCSKHLRGWKEAFGKIVGEEAKLKAKDAIIKALVEAFPVVDGLPVVNMPRPAFSGTVTHTAGGVTTVFPAGTTVSASTVSTSSATLPIVPEEPAIEGDVNGSSGTFYAEVVTAGYTLNPSIPVSPDDIIKPVDPVCTLAPVVEMLAGWPMTAKATVAGLAPNRRSTLGRLEDGRGVNIERSVFHNLKAGDSVAVRLIRAVAYPLYRVAKAG